MNTTLTFLRWEFDTLQLNSTSGGMQGMENWLIANTDLLTLECVLDEDKFERLIRYCKSYGDGGPNGRIRKACIPALERIGIIIPPPPPKPRTVYQ